MTDNGSNGFSASAKMVPPLNNERRRASLPLIILAVLFVVVPFLTWYLTWFGRPLSDAEMESYLRDEKNVRHVQQALTQIEERIEKGDASVKRWYPQVIALADSNGVEVRENALVARVTNTRTQAQEIRSPLPGKIVSVTAKEGARVVAGDTLLS